MDEKVILRKLRTCGPELLGQISWNPTFQRLLLSKGVIASCDVSHITTPPQNDEKSIKLVEHIEKDALTRYQPFIEALKDTEQSGPLRVLGEDGLCLSVASLDINNSVDVNSVGKKLKLKIKKSIDFQQIDLEPLYTFLSVYGILSWTQIEKVQEQQTSQKRISELLNKKLPARSPRHYVLFAKAIIESEQGHFLDYLELTEDERDIIENIDQDN